jgi:hypothetical protein
MVFLLAGLPAASAIAVEEPKGAVDWVGGYVQGIGYGTAKPTGNRSQDRMMALRAAEVMAQRALAETIHGVRVDGASRVRDAVKEFLLESRVQGVVRGAQKVKSEVAWDGNVPSATVELRVCLASGSPECRPGSSLVEILSTGRKAEPAYVPEDDFGAGVTADGPAAAPRASAQPRSPAVAYDASRPVTGLLLRVDGIRFERELFPVVVTRGEGGKFQTVYSARSVKPEVVRTHGVARFADTPEQAKGNPLLGDNPLVVTVREVTKENMLVMRPDGARAVRETTRFGNDYLSDAKVIVAGK